VTRTYNTDGFISQIVSASVTNSYSFDNANRITGISDSSNSALTWAFGYDALDRLTSGTTSAITDGWTYDADGNRLTQTGTNASTFHINSGNNQLSSTTGALARTYVYNAAGMTTAFGSDIFSYNNRGRMIGATVGSNATSYLYNALGQLIEKSGSSNVNVYVYDEAGHILGEYDGSGNLIEETVWLGDIPVATLQPSGSSVAINYVHTDHLNTPKKVTRASDNALVWRIDEDPFGTVSPNQNPSGLGTFVYNLRLPGQLYMAETGLNYNYFRDYDPQVGRYVESDPIGLRGGVNTYAYAKGNPISLRDPLGLCADSKLCSDPKYAQARQFIAAHLADALQIASQLDTSPGDILGLSGFESGYGTGFLITAGTNNYFSLTAGPAFGGTVGTYTHGQYTYGMYASYLASAQSFANSYFGSRVNGIDDPLAFAQALNANGSFNSENLPTPYAQSIANTINLVNALLQCP
jgi:RHS repeat-associated protein